MSSNMKKDKKNFKLGEPPSSSGSDDEDDFPGFPPCENSNLKIGKCNSQTKLPDYNLVVETNKPCASKCGKHIASNDDSLICNMCNGTYHLRCTDFDIEVYSVIKKKNYFNVVTWICDVCKANPQPPSNSELHDMIKILHSKFESLNTNSWRSVKEKITPTVKLTKQVVKDQITHQVIVSNDGSEAYTQSTLADRIKNNLKQVPIKNLRVAKDGCGILDFPNQKAQNDAISKLSKDFKVQPHNKPLRNLMPKVTLSGISATEYAYLGNVAQCNFCKRN